MHPSRLLVMVGFCFCLLAVGIVIATMYPVIIEELKYNTRSMTSTLRPGSVDVQMSPVDSGFGIVIPKVGANAHVIAHVDPYNADEYQQALSKGVAHAKGTALPGQIGNIFLFSHSSVDFWLASRYNSVFYLLSKLESGDSVIVYYQGSPYRYRVSEKRIVEPTEISFLRGEYATERLTLMTCWPPGTTVKRLLLIAERSE